MSRVASRRVLMIRNGLMLVYEKENEGWSMNLKAIETMKTKMSSKWMQMELKTQKATVTMLLTRETRRWLEVVTSLMKEESQPVSSRASLVSLFDEQGVLSVQVADELNGPFEEQSSLEQSAIWTGPSPLHTKINYIDSICTKMNNEKDSGRTKMNNETDLISTEKTDEINSIYTKKNNKTDSIHTKTISENESSRTQKTDEIDSIHTKKNNETDSICTKRTDKMNSVHTKKIEEMDSVRTKTTNEMDSVRHGEHSVATLRNILETRTRLSARKANSGKSGVPTAIVLAEQKKKKRLGKSHSAPAVFYQQKTIIHGSYEGCFDSVRA